MNDFIKKVKNRINKNFIDINILENSTIFISGMGRSGTTWLSELINYNNRYRDIFEPFIPYKVNHASNYKYLQYLNPTNNDQILVESAKNILSGNFRSDWTDANVSGFFYTKRIVKDIRTNLMLGWLKQIKPKMPIIITIRNPYSVIDSYKTLGWGKEAGGQKTDFERIISQNKLLKDFPKIREILKSINQNDYVSKLIFQWCVFYYVPLKQLNNKDYLLVQYENLLLQPKSELGKIFNYLNKPFNIEKILDRVDKPSVTNYRKIDFNINKNQLIEKWNQSLSTKEIKTINDIINKFEINFLYDKTGHPEKLNKENLWKT